MRSTRPVLLALVPVLVALLWGLALLHGVFERERDETLAAIAERRASQVERAKATVERALSERLRAAEREIELALGDPRRDDAHLLLVEGGRQLLPRSWSPLAGDGTPGRSLFAAVRAGGPVAAEPGSPWAERVGLLTRLVTAIEARDDDEITALFRALLAHRQRWVVPVELDLPALLAVIDLFATAGDPDPAFLEAVLHEGLTDARGNAVEPLDRLLLSNRHRFTAADLAFLAQRFEAVAGHRGSGAGMLARVRERRAAPVPVSPDLAAPAVASEGGWLMEPAGDGGVRGVAIDLAAEVDAAEAVLREAGLLASDESLTLAAEPPSTTRIDDLLLAVDSPRWPELTAAAGRRYALKTALLALCGGLAVALGGAALTLQRRRQRLVELQANLVAGVSHELRTPLSSIRLLAETLERRLDGEPRARDYPARIVRDADRLARLVDNVLAFNRLQRGGRPHPEPVVVSELVAALREDVDESEERTVELTTRDLDGARVLADPDLVAVLFGNLVRNAIAYNERDPVEISIVGVPPSRPGRCRLHVADNGWGLEPGEEERVFDDFFRSPASRRRGVAGTGLGLALCRRIARLHGGDVRVASSGLAGTTWEVELPEAPA